MSNLTHNQNHQPVTYLPFHSKQFWEDFYKKKQIDTINWYFDLTKVDLNDFNLKNISQDSEILIVGPGLSSTLDYFADNNYTKISVFDFSEECVNILKEKYSNMTEDWSIEVLDVSEIDSSYEGLFNVILDKGCLDCILSDPKNGEDKFVNTLNGLIGSLKSKGIFYYFSDGKIEDRINLLFKIPGIRYRVSTIDMNNIMKEEYKEFNSSDNIYYLYIITKN